MATTSCGRSRRHALLLATTVLVSGLAAPAFAQSAGSIAPPPVRQTVDENGADVIRGTFLTGKTEVSVGGANGLNYRSIAYNGAWSADTIATIDSSGSGIAVTVDGVSDGFTYTGGTYVSSEGTGATLVSTAGQYIYTSRHGTTATFAKNSGQVYGVYRANMGILQQIIRPDGYTESYAYAADRYCGSGWENGDCPSGVKEAWRLTTVTNSNGYRLSFTYAYNGYDIDLFSIGAWSRVVSVTASNLSTTAAGNSATATFNTTTDGSGNVTRTATDPLSRTTTYYKAAGLSGQMTIKRPGASTPNVTVTYSPTNYRVTNITREGVSYAYSYVDSGSTRTTTVTAPDSSTRVYVGDTITNLLASYRDELNRLTQYTYDSNGRVTFITMPEGNKVQYTYDARGNVIETRAISKTPGTPADIVTTAAYPSSCANVVTCNKPTSSTDAKANTTDYTYDATHGGVLTVTAPAPTTGAVRPQTRYGYATRNAYFSYVGGSPVAGPNTYMPISVSACRTTASCTGGADEVKTTIDYGPQVAGTPNNLLPVGITTGAGDGSLTATVTASYDPIGNRTYVDGPLAGTADTTRTLYDAARQQVGVIGPDPDGAGALLNRATRMTYNLDGQATLTELGTTAGQSNGNWAAFSPLQAAATTYDANARKTTNKVQSGGTTYALTQYSYDTRGRPDCTATRMNPAVFGSLPASACTLGTAGSFGPDRIGKTIYDVASQMTKTQTAVGTADVTDEATLTYTNNGRLWTLADGNNNLTTYEYDGFDRASKSRYPSATVPGTSSTTDYEQPTYDANGNVTALRLRDAQSISYTYDNLNRMTAKDRPNTVYWETDQSYGYDNLNRLKLASDSNGHQLSFTYDALGRTTALGDNWYSYGNMNLVYDLAGRRTQTIWADGFYAQYDRLVTGDVSVIRENGSTALGSYTYDNLGRRTTLARGNGTQTDYVYDAVSRLATLTNNLGATAHDVTTTFTYNPAGQIASSTRTNDAYAFPSFANKDAAETPNGLNQLTQQASTALGYDWRGNLTSRGSTSYGYTSENQLATATGVTGLAYDPLGHLFNFNAEGGINTTLNYDGTMLIGETNQATGALLRRYVHGPGADEVLVWYEGSGTSDRRWLYQDERGSVTAMANASGNATALNSYDDYGTPAAANTGRFGYTGQAWLPELGMWYYKARIYAPTLGRFMQTDPIGYGSGMNLYAYVGGDPVNLVDPSGLSDRVASQPRPDCPESNGCGANLLVQAVMISNLGPLLNAPGSGNFAAIGEGTGGSGPTPADFFENPIKDLVQKVDDTLQKVLACDGPAGDIAAGLYKGGGVVAKAGGATAGIGGAVALGGALAGPAGAAALPVAQPLIAAGAVGGIVGSVSQVVGAAFFAAHGNTAPLSNIFPSVRDSALSAAGKVFDTITGSKSFSSMFAPSQSETPNPSLFSCK